MLGLTVLVLLLITEVIVVIIVGTSAENPGVYMMVAFAPLLPSFAILVLVFYACTLLWRVQAQHEIKFNKSYVLAAFLYLLSFALEVSLLSAIVLKVSAMQQ